MIMAESFRILVQPQNQRLTVKSGDNLLQSLMEQGIFLRSDCGGNGKCGKCTVNKVSEDGGRTILKSCVYMASEDMTIEVPKTSRLSHVLDKAPLSFPSSFEKMLGQAGPHEGPGIAVDLGTTSMAVYLCDTRKGRALSSFYMKNPQAIYGDDVMSRISSISQTPDHLVRMQTLAIKAVQTGIQKLIAETKTGESRISRMIAVGNPTMIHILAGIDPTPLGISPYEPVFYEHRTFRSDTLGFDLDRFPVQTLPQVSGFIGGDILAGALAVDFEHQPRGTLLVDLGTNGELLFKGEDGYFAASCATGPAFEGAALSCGMQAIPGAVYRVRIEDPDEPPFFSVIQHSGRPGLKPMGICGSGVISAVTQLLENNMIDPGGALTPGAKEFVLVPESLTMEGHPVTITQKDIRSVQLGKSALMTGIELLIKKAGMARLEKIILAGAFGSHLDPTDMMRTGMIPVLNLDRVETAGNAAGTGAIMVLCRETYLEKAIALAGRITTVDLAADPDFQDVFVGNLNFQ